MKARMLAAATSLAACLVTAWPAVAAEYVLGPEDEIAVSVWMHPELERKVTIGADGSITFPPLGEVPASGLTPKKLADRIGDRLSTYLRQTTTVTIAVSRYMSRSVTVTGAVAQPGRYGFAELPSLLEVINAAGGSVPGSDLSRVQVIRKDGPDRGTTVVDVLEAQREGTGADLPALKPGDTIVIQSFTGAYAPAPGDGFAVLGEVIRPGIYQAGTGNTTTLWMALAQSGGLTSAGDLGSIKVVSLGGGGQQVSTFNLKDVLKSGGRGMPTIRAGEVLYVPRTTSSVAAKGWIGLTQMLALTADLVNIVIIADYLDRQ